MFTVVIFWQEKQLNEEINWFLEQNPDGVCMICVDNDRNQEEMKEELIRKISRRVNEREQWRLFLVDNYRYQCVSYNEGCEQTSCCCGSAKCTLNRCGMGRNPFISTYALEDKKNRQHREALLKLLNAILDIAQTRFIQPKGLFVIAVRDGDFSCRQEINIPNLEERYWEVGTEFPKQCRYLVYDMCHIYKGLREREIYWLYCLILLLSENELYMEQLLSGYAYRIEVNYSIVEYYKYLELCRDEVKEQLKFLEEQRIQCETEGDIKERALFTYPITLYNRKSKLEKTLKGIPGSRHWKKRKEEIEREIEEIYHDVSKEYEEQWEELRKHISKDDGENAEICGREKELYENQLLNMSFQKESRAVGVFEKVKSEDEILAELRKFCTKLEYNEKNKMPVWQCILLAMFLAVGTIVFFGYTSEWEIGRLEIGLYLACAVCTVVSYRGEVWWEQRKYKKQINDLLKYVDEYEEWIEGERKALLESTRNVMLYWKRVQNLNNYKEEIKQRKLEISRKEREYLKRKERLDAFWNMGEEDAEKSVKQIRKYEKEKMIFIGSRQTRPEFGFIEGVRFLRKETRRGRNT